MPRILIADDNPQNADLLEAHLDGTGYDTRVVNSGEDALAALRDSSGSHGRRRSAHPPEGC